MGIFLITLILLFLLWPTISRWIGRFAARKAEDYLRKAAGMPPRPGSGKKRRERSSRPDRESEQEYYYRQRRQRSHSSYSSGPIIPKEYAEDVEFVETKEFSQTIISQSPADTRRKETFREESQVSDAEWEEEK